MSIFGADTLDKFFEQCKCTREEMNLLVIYLAVIRLREQMKCLQQMFENRFLIDGDGI